MTARRSLLVGVALAAAVAVATPASVTGAHADAAPIELELTTGTGSAQLVLGPLGDFPSGMLPVTPAPGCTPLGPVAVGTSTGGTLCVGAPMTGGLGELQSYVPAGAGFVAGGPEAMAALGWIVEEGIEAIRTMYGIPLDARIQRYAAADIRAYVFTRVQNILDRYAYGQTLTAQEQATFDYVEEAVLAIDREVTTAAYEEFQRWQQSGCAYVPPAAPAFVTDPVGLPDDVRAWCDRAHNAYDTLFVFAPPQPTAEHFQAWGAYRNAHELGLDALEAAEAQKLLVDTLSAGAVLGGVAVAIGAAAITSALVGSSAALASAVAGAMGASATLGTAMTAFGPSVVGAMISGTAAMAAASVVAIVILAVVVTAVAIVQLVEHAKVGETIVARMDQAAEASDPFGLDTLRALGARPVLGDATPGTLPDYRNEANSARLAQLITTWLSVTPEGTVIPDATGVWPDNATTPHDHRFEVVDAAGTRVVDAITVPVGDGTFQEVRFNRSWMIVTPEGGAPSAALSFRFRDADGADILAARSATPAGGWVLTRASVTGPGFRGAQAAFIRYHDASGQLVTARIEPPQLELAGPHPTVVGPLVPGRTVNLRPNPVSVDGSFDLARYQSDYGYHWTLDRFDEGTGTWQGVAVEDAHAYGTRFTPTVVGQYRALVTMTELGDPDAEPVTGLVQFRVNPPEITADTIRLVDDGDELAVELRLTEPVASDTFTVEVQWPGELDADTRETETITLACAPLGLDCETAPIAHEYLRHPLSPTAELGDGVVVTVRNSHGGVLTRTLAVDDPTRPRIVAPVRAPLPGQLGTVRFGETGVAVQLVAELDADANPNYLLAGIEPGAGAATSTFSFVQPGGQRPTSIAPLGPDGIRLTVHRDAVSGTWAVSLWGTPRFDQLGSHAIPVAIQQDATGAVTAFMVRLEIVASPEDRYRGVLVNTVDPQDIAVPSVPVLQPQIIGGRAGWGGYAGEVCVSIREVNLPTPPAVRCGPADDFIDADGTPRPFPFEALLPGGVPATTLVAELRLADEDAPDAPAYAGRHEVRFLLESGPPRITALAWDGSAGEAALEIEPASAEAPITEVRCELDGAPVGCWGAAGGAWRPAALASGAHTLHVHVRDAARNYTSRELSFTVPDAGADDGAGEGADAGAGDGADEGAGGGTDAGSDAPGADGGAAVPNAGAPAPGGGASAGEDPQGATPDGDAPGDHAPGGHAPGDGVTADDESDDARGDGDPASEEASASDDRDLAPIAAGELLWILLALGLVLLLAVVVSLVVRRGRAS